MIQIHYIDDDTIDRMAFERTINRFTDFQCRCFVSWAEAIRAGKADVYVTDFHLPQEDIFDRIKTIHEPVIVTSGIFEEVIVEQLLEAGALGFIQKPIVVSELNKIILSLQIEKMQTDLTLDFDWTYLKELSGGDKEFEQEMMRVYQEEVPAAIQDMAHHLASENWLALAASIHKLKSKIRIVGLKQLGELAQTLEKSFKRQQASPEHIQQTKQLMAAMRHSVGLIPLYQ